MNTLPGKNIENSGADTVCFYKILSCFSIPKRYQLALLCNLGLMVSFSIRCNMGIALVVMINDRVVVDSNGNETIIVSYSLKFYYFNFVI